MQQQVHITPVNTLSYSFRLQALIDDNEKEGAFTWNVNSPIRFAKEKKLQFVWVSGWRFDSGVERIKLENVNCLLNFASPNGFDKTDSIDFLLTNMSLLTAGRQINAVQISQDRQYYIPVKCSEVYGQVLFQDDAIENGNFILCYLNFIFEA